MFILQNIFQYVSFNCLILVLESTKFIYLNLLTMLSIMYYKLYVQHFYCIEFFILFLFILPISFRYCLLQLYKGQNHNERII